MQHLDQIDGDVSIAPSADGVEPFSIVFASFCFAKCERIIKASIDNSIMRPKDRRLATMQIKVSLQQQHDTGSCVIAVPVTLFFVRMHWITVGLK